MIAIVIAKTLIARSVVTSKCISRGPSVSEWVGGGVKRVDLLFSRFPCFTVFWGVPRYPDAWKNSTEGIIVTPPFV